MSGMRGNTTDSRDTKRILWTVSDVWQSRWT